MRLSSVDVNAGSSDHAAFASAQASLLAAYNNNTSGDVDYNSMTKTAANAHDIRLNAKSATSTKSDCTTPPVTSPGVVRDATGNAVMVCEDAPLEIAFESTDL